MSMADRSKEYEELQRLAHSDDCECPACFASLRARLAEVEGERDRLREALEKAKASLAEIDAQRIEPTDARIGYQKLYQRAKRIARAALEEQDWIERRAAARKETDHDE